MSAAFPSLSDLAAPGFKIQGESTYDYPGISVSDTGDVNGDRIDDLIVAASTTAVAAILPAAFFLKTSRILVFDASSMGVGARGSRRAAGAAT